MANRSYPQGVYIMTEVLLFGPGSSTFFRNGNKTMWRTFRFVILVRGYQIGQVRSQHVNSQHDNNYAMKLNFILEAQNDQVRVS